jgi:hypothetical protein
MSPESIGYRTLIQVNLFVKVMLRLYSSRFFFGIVLILGNSLLFTPPGSMLRMVGVMLLFLLPGLIGAERWLSQMPPLPRWMMGAGLSYSLVIIAGLLLHYLPGPLPFWTELITLDVLALLPLLWPGAIPQSQPHAFSWRLSGFAWLLMAVLFLAAFFRLADLGYSEFHEDELEAMHPAAEALVGHQDALFVNRRKGPGEVLLPMMMWGLLGVINELSARLPFAVAGFLLVPTVYSLGDRLLANKWAGLIAASLIALNGMLVAFSRIVQFPVVVVWMSALALLCLWEWRAQGQARWLVLTGVFLGAGLLNHYAAAAVIPALAYGLLATLNSWPATRWRTILPPLGAAAGSVIVLTGLFYLPYMLDPQATRTLDYLINSRIGTKFIQNHLDNFAQVNVFFNSFYFVRDKRFRC